MSCGGDSVFWEKFRRRLIQYVCATQGLYLDAVVLQGRQGAPALI